MLKRILALIFVAVMFVFSGSVAYSENTSYDYGGAALEGAVPDEAAEYLHGEGITPDGGAGSITFGSALSWLWEVLTENISAPLRLLVSLCGVIMLCGLSAPLADNSSDRLSQVFTTVGVLTGAGMIVAALSDILSQALDILSAAAVFITTFIPVFAGIIAVMGRTASATAANTVTLAATQLFSQLAVNFLAPLSGAVMGLSITGAIHPQLNVSRLGELVRKVVVWILGLLMTVFMSILSLQTFVAESADSVLIRTAKFAVSSAVPIVGGTISDAVGTVHSSLGIIRSSVGTYGIVAAAVIILPTLLNVVSYRLAVTAAETVSDIFGVKELTALLKACGEVLNIIAAVIACFLLLNIIAAVIMLTMSGAA